MYSATITKSGQVTIPKELRDFLGVKPGGKITFNKEKHGVRIDRKLSEEEFFAALDKNISSKTRALIKKNTNKSVRKLKDEYMKSPRGQKEMKEKYAY